MKKEIWIHTDFYRPCSNAPANRIFAFANYFSSKDYKINIITIGEKTYVDKRNEATVYYLKDSYHFKKKTFFNRLLDNLTFCFKTRKFLKKNKKMINDCFFIVSIPEYISGLSSLVSKRYGALLIADVRDIWPEVAIEMNSFKPRSLPSSIFRRIARKYYTKSDYITTVSEYKVKHLCEITNHKFDNKIKWIGNGFDLDTLKLKSDYSILESYDLTDKWTVSYVGNIGRAQHLISLLSFAKKMQNTDYFFLVGGNGKDTETLKKYALDNDIKNVAFLGPVSKEQAKAIIELSKVSYIPLKSDKMVDSVPTKLFDSLGLGTPVLLIANGEACKILNKTKLGICLLPSQTNNLTEAFEHLRNNYEEILKYKDNSKSIIKNDYSRQKYCKDLEIILNKAIKQND